MKDTIAQSKLWVYSTAFVMAFNGGYINSICLVSILKNPAGYLTGNLTIAASSIVHGNFWLFAHVISLVLVFLFGSIVSGLVVNAENTKIDHRYNAGLILQSLIILGAMYLLLSSHPQANYLLAFCMGMQNAMTTHYGTALIRTTHMTGTTTDLGILISHWMKGHPVELWKVALYTGLIISFGFGAIFGALIYNIFYAYALLASVFFYIALMSWRWFQLSSNIEECA